MLIIFQTEFNTVHLAYFDNRIYNRIRKQFLATIPNEKIVDTILQKYWNYTLRELSCNSMINIMDCFILLQNKASFFCPGVSSAFYTKRGSKILTHLYILPIAIFIILCYTIDTVKGEKSSGIVPDVLTDE